MITLQDSGLDRKLQGQRLQPREAFRKERSFAQVIALLTILVAGQGPHTEHII